MSLAHKKVVVRRFAGSILAGYLPASAFVRHDAEQACAPSLDLLDPGGRRLPLSLLEIKMVSYVRDFNLADTANPERLGRRSFLARPRGEGLWVRLTLRDGDMLEGLASSDLSLLSHAVEDAGLHITPPDTRSNTQRIFVPRAAMVRLEVLAVITTPSRKRPGTAEPAVFQEALFPAPANPADALA